MWADLLAGATQLLASDDGWLLAAMIRSAAVLAGAVLLAALFRFAGARVRAGVLAVGLLAALVVPALAAVMPNWSIPVPTAPPTNANSAANSPLLGLDSDAILALLLAAPDVIAHQDTPTTAAPAADAVPASAGSILVRLAVTVWAAGAIAVLGWLGLGLFRIRAIVRRATPLTETGWNDAVRDAAARIGLRRRVRVSMSPQVPTPMTGGVLRPVVLMPPDALRWSAERRAIVLQHELVHVRRLDWLAQIVARLACAAYWFNPLTWVAARWLHLERERACDAGVIALGTPPSVYARHLLDVALARSPRMSMPTAALAMAHRSELEVRLMSIRTHRPARRGLTAMLPALIGVSVLALGSAAVEPFAAAGPPEDLARDIDRMEKELAVAKMKLAEMKAQTSKKKARAKADAHHAHDTHASHDDHARHEHDAEGEHDLRIDIRSALGALEGLEGIEGIDGAMISEHVQRALDMAMKHLHRAEGEGHEVRLREIDLSELDGLEAKIRAHVAPMEERIHARMAPLEHHILSEIEPLERRIEMKLRPFIERVEAAEGHEEQRRELKAMIEMQIAPLQEAIEIEMAPLHEAIEIEMAPLHEKIMLELEPLHEHLMRLHEESAPSPEAHGAHQRDFTIDHDAIRRIVEQAKAHAHDVAINKDAIRKIVEQAKAHAHAHDVAIDKDAIRKIVEQARSYGHVMDIDKTALREIAEPGKAHAHAKAIDKDAIRKIVEQAKGVRRDRTRPAGDEIAELRAMLRQLKQELAELKRAQGARRR